ncbi:hypothetical protein [Paenibacillus sp. 481]|uniref:hypothetical protein n=1 Tax=Paenibacillus sp. 481 TaxID=2835869 RepID=UPI001E5AE0C1|nr:hypothetical protein [Paenibacillus sp. 481]UHA75273.1 hypothetical protein KIK04_09830 [Paenibacillus sp. 481]
MMFRSQKALLMALVVVALGGCSPAKETVESEVVKSSRSSNHNETDTAKIGADRAGEGVEKFKVNSPTDIKQNDGVSADEVVIKIDQDAPTLNHMFWFSIEKLPKGFVLSEMEWKSDMLSVRNTYEIARENGATGEAPGFFISGDGRTMGFDYNEEMKGEQGTFTLTFESDKEKSIVLVWDEQLTLK